MDRRGFLALIGMAAPALVLDPELALWVPGKKTFFLPPEPVLYRSGCNQLFLTHEIITREALRILQNNLIFTSRITREYVEDYPFVAGDQWPLAGSTLHVLKPRRFA